MSHTIIGTAGHIDHGKTLLVRALTGTDTDAAPQEKARGITIELGFAFFGDQATIIDVPGHERFVKTMVAGVSTIDLALLVIAADDGVMPQTREHVDVLELLGVPRGIVVLNKVDLVDEDWLDLVEEEVREVTSGTFLEEAPISRVSALAGTGIDTLKDLLAAEVAATVSRSTQGPFRLPVDRIFLVKGFGAVCTGSVLTGSLHAGDSVDVLPSGTSHRVRSLQQHGQNVAQVGTGDRAALNLPGIELGDIERGDVLVGQGYFKPTYMLDARLDLLSSSPKVLLHRARIRLHIGTCEVLGRVQLLDREVLEPGDSALVQIRLETPVVAVWGDRYVIRRYSPPLTIGGGRVLDPHPRRYRTSDVDYGSRLLTLDRGSPEEVLGPMLLSGEASAKSASELSGDLGLNIDRVESELADLEAAGQVVLMRIDNRLFAAHHQVWDDLERRLEAGLTCYHADFPLRPGPNREELRGQYVPHLGSSLYDPLLRRMEQKGRIELVGATVRTSAHRIRFTDEQEKLKKEIETTLMEADWADMPDPANLAERLQAERSQVDNMLRALQDLGCLVGLEGGLVLHTDIVDQVRISLRQELENGGQITVAEFRDLVGTNRRYALGLLSLFDAEGLTQRRGDVRILQGNG